MKARLKVTYQKYFKPTKAKIFDTDNILNPVQEDGTQWASNGYIAIKVDIFKGHPLYAYWNTYKREGAQPNMDRVIPNLRDYRTVTPSNTVKLDSADPETTLGDGGITEVTINPYFIAFFESLKTHKLNYKAHITDEEKPVCVFNGDMLIGLIMPIRRARA